MKFGKSLSNQIEKTLPEWRDKFLSYKELKKKLKNFEPAVAGEDRLAKRQRVDAGNGDPTAEAGNMSKEERDFRNLLENELEKFNNFFVEKEEEYIIRIKVLSSIHHFFIYVLPVSVCLFASKISFCLDFRVYSNSMREFSYSV